MNASKMARVIQWSLCLMLTTGVVVWTTACDADDDVAVEETSESDDDEVREVDDAENSRQTVDDDVNSEDESDLTDEVDMNAKELMEQMRESAAKGDWERAISSVLALAEQTDDASRAAKYYYTAGVMYRDELEKPVKAVEMFEEALDADPVNKLEAFEAIDRVLTQNGDWPELARAHRRMIRRLHQLDDDELDEQLREVQIALWRNLGEVYTLRLEDEEVAAQAFDMADRLEEEYAGQ